MKQLLLLFLCLGSISSHAQCVETTTSDDPVIDDSPMITNDMREGKDFSGNYALKGLILGGGFNTGILSSGIGKEMTGIRDLTRYTNTQWNQGRPAGFVEIMYQLDRERKMAFGFFGSWSSLWEREASYTEKPQNSGTQSQNGSFGIQEEGSKNVQDLRWNLEQKARQGNFMFFSELEFLRFGKRIYLFARPEIGISYYKNKAVINVKDSCDCDHFVRQETESKVSFTSGIGVGLNWGNDIIGLKSMLGYRIYNPVGFSSRNYLESWQGEFDGSSYDYMGNPASGLFSIDKPEAPEMIGRRNGVLYFQLGIYLNFGCFNK